MTRSQLKSATRMLATFGRLAVALLAVGLASPAAYAVCNDDHDANTAAEVWGCGLDNGVQVTWKLYASFGLDATTAKSTQVCYKKASQLFTGICKTSISYTGWHEPVDITGLSDKTNYYVQVRVTFPTKPPNPVYTTYIMGDTLKIKTK